MPQPNPVYVDGYVTPERQTTVVPDVVFPFENYPAPDTYARILTRRYDVTPAYFTPKIGVRTSWTNYLLYTETFANAAWTKTNITNTDAQLANPNDGSVTMSSGLETSATGEHAYQQAYTFTATAHTLSWIIQPNGRTWFRLKANDGTTNFTGFFYLTGLGVVGTVANCTGAVAIVAPGVYRISITFTPAAAAGNVYLNYSTDGSTVSYAGNTALGAYVWAAQIVRASTAGPVIITTSALRTVSSPNLDASDIFAYLVSEQSPKNYNSQVASIQRQFARIPANQVSYPGSKYFTKPNYTPGAPFNPFSAGATPEGTGVSFPLWSTVGNATYTTSGGIFTDLDSKVYTPVKAGGTQLAGYASAGTFTLTYGANTTANLNYNDSAATISTAINGLASIISAGITASVVVNALNNSSAGGGVDISLSGGTDAARQIPITMDATGLTVNTSKNPTTTSLNVSYQQIKLPTHLTVTAHGLSTSLALAVCMPSGGLTIILPTAYWGSIDSNTLWVPNLLNNTASMQLAGTYSYTYAPAATTTYTGGVRLVRTRETEIFYLPGVSTGITVPSDIPVPADMQNPNTFLTALLTLSGWQTYQSEGPAPWNGTNIYRLKKIDVFIADFT